MIAKLIALVAVALVLHCPASWAQQPPSKLPDEFSATASDFTVLTSAQMDEQHRRLLWADTKVDVAGFLRTSATLDYLRLIEKFATIVDQKIPSPADLNDYNRVTESNFRYVGTLKEDAHRRSLVFTDSKSKLMFTVWNFRAAGAKVIVMDEFFNQSVNGTRAVVSLSTSPPSRDAIWKLAWWSEGVGYELYISDTIDSAERPARNVKEVLRIAEALSASLQ